MIAGAQSERRNNLFANKITPVIQICALVLVSMNDRVSVDG